MNILLQEQRLGAFISGPRAKQKNVPGIPADGRRPTALCGAGLVFQVSVNGGVLFSAEFKPRALGPPTYWGALGSAGMVAQVLFPCSQPGASVLPGTG